MIQNSHFSLFAQVLYIILSWTLDAHAYDVQNEVCMWNNKTSACERKPEGLVNLLTESGDMFALFMRCQHVTSQPLCNNLSEDTCVWKNGACHISSSKLVNQITSCFIDIDSLQIQNKKCEGELLQISSSIDWIDRAAVRPASGCSSLVGWIQQTTVTCRLMEESMRCGQSSNEYCEESTSSSNQAYQFVSDLRQEKMLVNNFALFVQMS
eukprot:TRINITY_DN26974_c0_g2_i3.p1 TRINITY_DN26974_c0_g2~~TRINITY_DN26974_c0_g2_i3.p1  ORF type:complete len:210 (-),score=11.74 TRINITY_DN26974_c0_g2_i3:34-663(-)